MLDAQLSGVSPVIYHITNILLHVIASCLVFKFFTQSAYTEEQSLFVSLIFAVHPVLTQAVAWIPGRNDSLMTVFALFSFIFLKNCQDTQKPKDYFLHLIFFLFALFTKESAVLLVLVFALYIKLILRKPFNSPVNRFLAAGWAAMLLVWMFARNSFLKPAYGISIERQIKLLFESLPALIQYTGKIVFPVNLSVLPVIKDTTFIYGGAAIAIILLALALSKNKRPERIYFGLFWFLIFLLPSFCVPNNYFHEHRLYLPLIGFMILVSGIGAQLNARTSRLAGTLLIIVLSALTFRHSGNYKDRYVYWANAEKTSPHSAIANQGAGINYLDAGNIEEAEGKFKESIKLDEHNARSHMLLGMVYWYKKMFNESEAEFRQAIVIDPNSEMAYASYAGFCKSRKRIIEAETYWKKPLELNPGNIDVYKHLAVLCFRDNRPEEAARSALLTSNNASMNGANLVIDAGWGLANLENGVGIVAEVGRRESS